MTDLLRALEQHFARLARAERHRAELLAAIAKAQVQLGAGTLADAQRTLHDARMHVKTELEAFR